MVTVALLVLRESVFCNEDGMRGRQLRKIACGGFGVDLFLF